MAAVSSCQAGRRCSRPGGGSVIGARWPGSSRVHPCGAGPGGPRGRAAGGAGRRSRGRGNERRGLGRPGGGSVSRGGGGRGGGRTFRGPGSRGGGACYRLRCCESAPAGGDSGFRRRKASGDRSLVRVAGLVMSGEIRFTGPHPAGHPGVALGWRLSRGSGARVAWARRLPPGGLRQRGRARRGRLQPTLPLLLGKRVREGRRGRPGLGGRCRSRRVQGPYRNCRLECRGGRSGRPPGWLRMLNGPRSLLHRHVRLLASAARGRRGARAWLHTGASAAPVCSQAHGRGRMCVLGETLTCLPPSDRADRLPVWPVLRSWPGAVTGPSRAGQPFPAGG